MLALAVTFPGERLTALNPVGIAPVSVVVPIQRLAVIFRILFDGTLNRDHEVIAPTILLSLIGVVALTMGGATVLSVFGITGPLAEMLTRPIL